LNVRLGFPTDRLSRNLRGEDQFAVLRQPQAVIAAFMFDDQLAALAEQMAAHYPTAQREKSIPETLISLGFPGVRTRFHTKMITVLITGVNSSGQT
jgi:hypothetical protein